MKIYIAGKITGLIYEHALLAFAAAEADVRELGHVAVNPMKENGLDGDGKEHPWTEYMRRVIPHLLSCDAIYLLPNWQESKGARLEKHIAEMLGMRIIFAASSEWLQYVTSELLACEEFENEPTRNVYKASDVAVGV